MNDTINAEVPAFMRDAWRSAALAGCSRSMCMLWTDDCVMPTWLHTALDLHFGHRSQWVSDADWFCLVPPDGWAGNIVEDFHEAKGFSRPCVLEFNDGWTLMIGYHA